MKLLFFLMVSITTVFGQCEFDVSASDITCSEQNDCVGTTDCELKVFTVPCSGCYCLKAGLDCGEESCQFCQICANVYNDGVPINESNCHNLNCHTTQCVVDCCEGAYQNIFYLEKDVEYKLYVCKQHCEPYDCEDCDENCVAWATLNMTGIVSCE